MYQKTGKKRYGVILMIIAKKNASGQYVISSTNPSETYSIRGKLKAAGGRWDGNNWIGTQHTVDTLKIKVLHEVRIAAHCHMPESKAWATDTDIQKGTLRRGCSMCDTSDSCGDDVKIIEVIN